MIITIQGELHDLCAQSPCMEVTRVGEAPTGKRLKTIRGGWTGNYMSREPDSIELMINIGTVTLD